MLCLRLLTRISPNGKCTLPTISQLQVAVCGRSPQSQCSYSSLATAPSAYTLQQSWPTRMACCQYSTTGAGVVDSQENKSAGNIFKRVLKQVGFTPNDKTRLKVSSILLYESVADKVNYLSFFQNFNLPNTFNSWFLVTELHVWMLLLRAMAEGAESGENGRFLRNCIVEAMWSDVNARAKKLGAHNPSKTRQQIEVLSEQFQAALIAYDEGIMSDDRVLAGALWRRFFAMNCDDFEKIERLVKYVRLQVVMLDEMPREDFLHKPKIPWMDLEKINI